MAGGRWVVSYYALAAGAARRRRDIFAENTKTLENSFPNFFSPAARFGLDPKVEEAEIKDRPTQTGSSVCGCVGRVVWVAREKTPLERCGALPVR